ncbi:hypothetical protein CCF60_003146 [Salmonella enterica subsp. enterica serovar Berkeley]|nr:hypothetical protein [Salmonella enterica subsp. enterica serovar Berkeley]
MAFWVSAEMSKKLDGTKVKIFDIAAGGYTTTRPGVAILRSTAWGNRWVNTVISCDGVAVAQKQHGDNWGATINAFVPAGCKLTASVGGDGGIQYFKFMEF